MNNIFENKRIPNFNKCISTALELQKRMPFVRCIGWDMVIDKNDEVKINGDLEIFRNQ